MIKFWNRRLLLHPHIFYNSCGSILSPSKIFQHIFLSFCFSLYSFTSSDRSLSVRSRDSACGPFGRTDIILLLRPQRFHICSLFCIYYPRSLLPSFYCFCFAARKVLCVLAVYVRVRVSMYQFNSEQIK